MVAGPREHAVPPADKPGRRDFAGVLAGVCALAAFAVLCAQLLTRRVYVEDDLAAYHLPFRAFYHQCLQRGDNFLWSPYIFNGFYLHGDGQVGMLHPLHWLLYRCFPLDTAFTLDLLSSYPLVFAGMFLLLRRWRLPGGAALFGATLSALLGFNMNHFVHMAFVGVMAHVPWALYAIDVAMRGSRPRRGLVLLLAAGTSQLLLGFPQGVYYAWMMEAAYAVFLAWHGAVWRRLAALASVKLLSVLLGMIQLLPTWDVMKGSFRAAPDVGMQLSVSLHPLNFLGLLNPYLFQWRYFGPIKGDEPWDAPYMGAAATILLLYSLLAWRSFGKRRPLLAFAWGLVLFGAISALGKYGVLYHLYAWLPLVNKFRAHARHLCIAHTGMALIAALAFAQLSELRRDSAVLSWRRLGWLMALPAASGALALAVVLGRGWGAWTGQAALLHFTMPVSALAIGAGFIVSAALLVAAAARGYRFALAGLVLLTFADIGLYSLRHKPQATLEAFRQEVSLPPAPVDTRVDPDIHPMFMNRFGMHGLRGVYGYTSFMPERQLDYTLEAPLRLAGVQWRETRAAASPELAAAKAQGVAWVPFPGGLPRARLLCETSVNRNPAADLENVDPARIALVETSVDLPQDSPGQAQLVEDRPGAIQVMTNAPGRQILAVAESYHPGWRVSIDDAPTRLLRLYGDFIGCVVPAGTHRVTLHFDPASYSAGKWLTCAGMLLSTLLFLIPLGLRGGLRQDGSS